MTETINFEKKEYVASDKERGRVMQETNILSRNTFAEESNEDKNYCKVRDHCHYTGKYRGAAHGMCNLR